jgi:hypothetical protein
MPISAKLVLAGMNVRAIADDPEQAAVLDEVVAAVRRLPHPERSRVHLVCLPVAESEELGWQSQRPVVAIHRNHDPHPSEEVQEPLALILRSFKFLLLKNCGHHPWIGRAARDRFYDILREELR